MKTPSTFSWHRVVSLSVVLWAVLVFVSACGLLPCSWIVVLALPVALAWVGLVAFIALGGVACLLLRFWLWLVTRAQARRREREIREFHRAVEHGLVDLLDRPMPRDEEARRG